MPSIWDETPSLPKSNSNHVICHHPKTAPTVRKIYHHHDKKNPNTAPILLENNNNNNNNNNSDQSDYGELRAIVQRIERNRNESKQVVGVSANNASGGGGSHNNNNRFQQQQANKKLVFDYVPASVMMKK